MQKRANKNNQFYFPLYTGHESDEMLSSMSMTVERMAIAAVSTRRRLWPNPTGTAPALISDSNSSDVKSAQDQQLPFITSIVIKTFLR